ncbi:glycosyltransferase family 39 protein [Candidatus Woesebacteria bacterium]|nr:MAG: glycosyltransferase family 39 protein [Candidatus Woesebacteria bacterium]
MKKTIVGLLLLISLHVFFLGSLKFTAWPEMLAYPYLFDNGFALFGDMIHPYPPMLTGMLSLWYSLWGYNVFALKLLTWIFIIFIDLYVYLIASKLTGNKHISLLALLYYVLLQPFLDGNMLWFDLAFVPFLLAGTYFGIRSLTGSARWTDFALASSFISIACLIKQTAGLFLIVFLLFIVVYSRNKKAILSSFFPPFYFGFILLTKLSIEGSLAYFVNWVVWYPFTFWSKFPGYVQMQLRNQDILILTLLSFPVVFGVVKARNIIIKDRTIMLVLFFLGGSFVSVYPRFSFFHFQAALCFLILLTAYFSNRSRQVRRIALISGILLVIGIVPRVITNDWGKETRFYGTEDVNLAHRISDVSTYGESVYLMGLPSSLYVYSKTLPPKPWVDNYGWYLEIPNVQQNTIAAWELNPPEIIIWSQPKSGNWYDLGTYQPKEITKWITVNYNESGMMDEDISIWKRKN